MLRNISQLRSRTLAIFRAAPRYDRGIRFALPSQQTEDAMATATLIDTERAVKPGVRRQRADGRQPTRSQMLDLAGERDRVPELNAKTAQRLTLIHAAFRPYR